MKIADSSVIVTGAGSGIGRALALEFARNGAKVVCCGRNKDRLDETVKLIEDDGEIGLAVATDITQPEQVQHLVDVALTQFSAIDVLFNNAGSFRSIAGVHEVDPELWWQDVTVNLYGALLMIRHVLPHMMERNAGIIISMDGGRPVGGTGYSCGKAGLMELTRIMVEELKMTDSDVMVFGAGPGLVDTDMTRLQAETEAGRKWMPSTRECLESGNVRQPEEIARATIRLVQHAKPQWSGMSYGPDTDFTKL